MVLTNKGAPSSRSRKDTKGRKESANKVALIHLRPSFILAAAFTVTIEVGEVSGENF